MRLYCIVSTFYLVLVLNKKYFLTSAAVISTKSNDLAKPFPSHAPLQNVSKKVNKNGKERRPTTFYSQFDSIETLKIDKKLRQFMKSEMSTIFHFKGTNSYMWSYNENALVSSGFNNDNALKGYQAMLTELSEEGNSSEQLSAAGITDYLKFVEFDFGDDLTVTDSAAIPISACQDAEGGGTITIYKDSATISSGISLGGSVLPSFEIFDTGVTFNVIQLGFGLSGSLTKTVSFSLTCDVLADNHTIQAQEISRVIIASSPRFRFVQFNPFSGSLKWNHLWSDTEPVTFIAHEEDENGIEIVPTAQKCASDSEDELICGSVRESFAFDRLFVIQH